MVEHALTRERTRSEEEKKEKRDSLLFSSLLLSRIDDVREREYTCTLYTDDITLPIQAIVPIASIHVLRKTNIHLYSLSKG